MSEVWIVCHYESLWKCENGEIKKRQEVVLTLEFSSVRTKGLEPPRLTALDPKSNAATNYATCAKLLQKYKKKLIYEIFGRNNRIKVQKGYDEGAFCCFWGGFGLVIVVLSV